jgi:glucose/sorbosone dehydrogenase
MVAFDHAKDAVLQIDLPQRNPRISPTRIEVIIASGAARRWTNRPGYGDSTSNPPDRDQGFQPTLEYGVSSGWRHSDNWASRTSRIVHDGVLDPNPIAGMPQVQAQGIAGLMDIELHARFIENKLIYFTYHKPAAANATAGNNGGTKTETFARKASLSFR